MSKDTMIVANPSLKPLESLLGRWDTQISWSPETHKLVGGPTTIHGTSRFECIEDGQYIVQRQSADASPPDARWLIGRDETAEEYAVLYADKRGVSRIYRMSFGNQVWRVWRNAPGLNQRFEGRITADGRTIDGHWEKSDDGDRWKLDFGLKYVKAD